MTQNTHCCLFSCCISVHNIRAFLAVVTPEVIFVTLVQVFLLSTIAQPTDQGGPGAEPYKQWGVFNAVTNIHLSTCPGLFSRPKE